MAVVSDLSEAELQLFADIVARLQRIDTGSDVRGTILPYIVRLLRSEFGASYVWDTRTRRFVDPRVHNVSLGGLARHDDFFQFHDPMSHRLRNRRSATMVEEVLSRREMEQSDFYNEFLRPEGMHHGINIYVFEGDRDLGDLRIWRNRRQPEFTQREKILLDTLEPHLRQALIRARGNDLGLTRREREVVALVARGCTDHDIASVLGIRFGTVRTHMANAMEKAGAANRAELAAAFASTPPADQMGAGVDGSIGAIRAASANSARS
jgi:DNA-binding CsgD family transcriptional regulator